MCACSHPAMPRCVGCLCASWSLTCRAVLSSAAAAASLTNFSHLLCVYAATAAAVDYELHVALPTVISLPRRESVVCSLVFVGALNGGWLPCNWAGVLVVFGTDWGLLVNIVIIVQRCRHSLGCSRNEGWAGCCEFGLINSSQRLLCCWVCKELHHVGAGSPPHFLLLSSFCFTNLASDIASIVPPFGFGGVAVIWGRLP